MSAVPPPPHDTAAEKAVLGACLYSVESFDDAEATGLCEGDFYTPAHGQVWDSVSRLVSKTGKADTITVQADLDKRGLLEAIGGPGTLLDLAGSAGGLTSAGSYAERVIECSQLRGLIAAAADINKVATGPVEDVGKVLAWAEEALGKATDRNTGANRPEPASQMMVEWVARLNAPDADPGILTPWARLNRMTGGLRPGLTVVFARPGVGKSAWGMNVAVHAARSGVPTLLCSLEMDRASIADRLIAWKTGLNHSLIRDRKVGHRDEQRVLDAATWIGELPLHVHDGYDQTVANISSACRRIPNLGLLIIDYAQLLTPATTGRRADNRQSEVAAVSQELVRLRRRLGIAVVALAQSNRPQEAGVPKRPTVRDIRETGQLENDADLIISLFREEMGDPKTTNKGTMEMTVHKQRSGPSGETATVGWVGSTFSIQEMAAP